MLSSNFLCFMLNSFVFSTVDPRTTWVWTGQVLLYLNVFNKYTVSPHVLVFATMDYTKHGLKIVLLICDLGSLGLGGLQNTLFYNILNKGLWVTVDFGMYQILEPVTLGYQGITIIKFLESQIHEYSTAQGSASQTPTLFRGQMYAFSNT